jgi:hypothetical protein
MNQVATSHRVECEHTHKLNAILSSERGVQVWCKICKRPEWIPRVLVLDVLLTEEEKRLLRTVLV